MNWAALRTRTNLYRIVIAAALIAALALAVACGDDDDRPAPEIRTENGLGVGLLAANADLVRGQAGSDGEGGGLAPGVPSDDEARGLGGEVSVLPALQTTAEGLTVSGYGVAIAQADLAVIEFYFANYGAVRPGEPATGEGGGTDSSASATSDGALSEADLQPVIDAIVGQGVSRDDIEFLTGSYYDYYYSSATLRVRLAEIGKIGAVVDAAISASAGLTNASLQSTSVSYMAQDCAPLEQAALDAAVADAETRGAALAGALGVTQGSVVAAYDYAYSPFGGSSCDTGYIGPYPLGGTTYAEGQLGEVQVYANVLVTYAIQ
jgi:uncharacterized protein YggE